MNLFLLLHALGLGHELHGRHVLPIGTVYDPFVCRGLDAFIYALYSGARFVVVGTPAGITLAPEGGAHQSTITPSIGLELPGVTYAEPAYARALDWLLCDGLAGLARPDGGSLYLRLSTRPIDQAPFGAGRRPPRCRARCGPTCSPAATGCASRTAPAAVVLAACGAVRARRAGRRRGARRRGPAGARARPHVTGPALPRDGATGCGQPGAAGGSPPPTTTSLRCSAPAERRLPIVTVHDAASHHLAWLGAVFGAPVVPVGVDDFGQSGSIPELYGVHDLLPEQIVNAALVAVS